ncbi:hypothetical protein CLPUN_09810 [Clostridium puniceum]|uniref:DUF2577 domain-containing protein n=1 Tax=Clostridium puniceum TaxID=29367 RepID=A0A1S8TVI2_9CLOT|nr:DUF2577 family protein [Clostridium puniceum]OOM81797.1 hypothetical protein CLPUN_09810 [Clostridium puniceum]
MGYDVEFAKQFRSRDNIKPTGAQLGEVISINPLRIAIYGNEAILESQHCYMCSAMVERFLRKADMRIKAYSASISTTDTGGYSNSSMRVADKSDYEIEILFKEIIKIGDMLLCMPTVDGQHFFIIDKVVLADVSNPTS